MNLGKVSTGSNYRKIFLLFLMVAVVFSVFVLYFVIGKVDIILIPKQTEQDFEFSFTLEGASKKSNYEQAIIPGQFIEKTFDQEITITDGLSSQETSTPAQGTVTIYNESPNAKSLVVNTQLQSDSGLIFLTTSAVTIPARSNTDVGVIAAEEGSEYEIDATHFIIKNLSSLKSVFYAESDSAMSIQSSNDKIIEEDALALMLDKSEDALAAKLETSLAAEIESGYTFNQDSVYIDMQSLAPLNSGIEEKDGNLVMSDDTEYVIAEAFKIRIKGVAYGYAYQKQILNELIEAQANFTMGDEFEYNGLADEEVKIAFEKAIPEKGKAYFTASSTIQVTYRLDNQSQDKKALVGFNKADIMKYYKQLEIVEDVQIKFNPEWIKNVPANEKNINIEILEPVEKVEPEIEDGENQEPNEDTSTDLPEEINQAS